MTRATLVTDDAPSADELRAQEPDLLTGLIAAGEFVEAEHEAITIQRKGKKFFSFRIRPLSEREFQQCRDQSTVYKRNKQLGGIKVPEESDQTRYRSLIIYTATVDEDRAKLWDSKEAHRRFGVLGPIELIDKVLLAGEKNDILDKIDELSGYGLDLLEDAAKN